MKKVIVLGIIVVCIGLMYQYPHVMLNPGELVEGHQKLNEKCLSCHKPFWGISNDKCISCHKLSEIGKDTLHINDTIKNKEKFLFHQNLANQECASCHTDHKGVKPDMPLSSFPHELLSETVISKCSGCHNKPSDNIHQQISVSCNNCHNTKGWKSSVVFNHDMIQGTDKNNCASCHQKPNDSYHNLFKDNCNKCHSTSKWVPSSFDHSAYFQLAEDHNAKCNTCHTNNNFSTYTCYGCHEHSQNKIMEEHNKHGINNFSNCASCHRSGNEHDEKRNGNSKELNQKEINNVKDYIKSQEKDEKKEKDDD